MKEILKIRNLNISFMMKGQHVDAVQGVSLDLDAGRSMALVGESGCGKTALCRTIMRLHSGHAHVRGSIKLAENSIKLSESSVRSAEKSLSDAENNFAEATGDRHIEDDAGMIEILEQTEEQMEKIRGSRIAMVFQDPMTALDPTYSIGKQISESIRLHKKMSKGEAMGRAIDLLEQVGIGEAEKRAKQYPHHFSGGMRQRVAIAAALALDPDILICDEPTTALDLDTQDQIVDLLIKLQKEKNMAMIFVTHDMGLVEKVADNICVMKEGKILEKGECRKVLKDPQNEYTKELIRYAQYGKGTGHTHGDIHFHGGKAHSHPSKIRWPILKVKHVKKSFELFGGARRTVFEDFSMEIGRGEVVGLVDPSGCGKSTLGRMIMGIERPDSGQITTDYISKQIIFQDSASAFNERMTLEEIIAEPLVIRGDISKDSIHEKVLTVAGQAGLEEELLSRHPYDVSGGQRQRAAIARALITDPDLIIADEPISSLDVSIQSQIVHLLKNLSEKRGLAILLIAHDLPMVEHVADRIIQL